MKIFIALLLLLFPSFLFAQSADTLFKVYDVKQQKEISLQEIIDNSESANVIFFGEDHNDSICHVVEYLITEKLYEKYNSKVAISMEMFHTDVQPILDEYLLGLITERNFLKEVFPWPNYSDYKPIVEFAKANKINVIGANVASRYSNAVTTGGLIALQNFPKSSKQFLPPLPIDTAIGEYATKFNETLGGHGMGGMKIYQTQNLWDASMAWSITKYLKKNKNSKILQINGRFHSDEKLGTVTKLLGYYSKANITTISSFSGKDFKDPKWQNYKKLADFIVLTNPNVAKTY